MPITHGPVRGRNSPERVAVHPRLLLVLLKTYS